jgi:hypothetical protein
LALLKNIVPPALVLVGLLSLGTIEVFIALNNK